MLPLCISPRADQAPAIADVLADMPVREMYDKTRLKRGTCVSGEE
jgi:hypothetical protein